MTRGPAGKGTTSAGDGGGAVHRRGLAPRLRFGYVVFAALLVTEVIEFAMGTRVKKGSWPFLLVLAAVGAWPIVSYYMHVTELRHPKE